jgi:hypothetical protein
MRRHWFIIPDLKLAGVLPQAGFDNSAEPVMIVHAIRVTESGGIYNAPFRYKNRGNISKAIAGLLRLLY